MPVGRMRLATVVDLVKRVIRTHKTKRPEPIDDPQMATRQRRRAAEVRAAVEVAHDHRRPRANQLGTRRHRLQHVVDILRCLRPQADRGE